MLNFDGNMVSDDRITHQLVMDESVFCNDKAPGIGILHHRMNGDELADNMFTLWAHVKYNINISNCKFISNQLTTIKDENEKHWD